jgi:hypothetical protein
MRLAARIDRQQKKARISPRLFPFCDRMRITSADSGIPLEPCVRIVGPARIAAGSGTRRGARIQTSITYRGSRAHIAIDGHAVGGRCGSFPHHCTISPPEEREEDKEYDHGNRDDAPESTGEGACGTGCRRNISPRDSGPVVRRCCRLRRRHCGVRIRRSGSWCARVPGSLSIRRIGSRGAGGSRRRSWCLTVGRNSKEAQCRPRKASHQSKASVVHGHPSKMK